MTANADERMTSTNPVKLSVVIPVYNVQLTLNRCIESVVSQDYEPLQIVLVDDGSPDNCPRMCDEWAKRDARIEVVHKCNGGLSDARNVGISRSVGEYVTFVDSDDYLAPHTYSSVMQAMKADYDLLEFAVVKNTLDGKAIHMSWGQCVYDQMSDYWYRGRAYEHTYACNKIFRRQLFDTVKFPVGKLFEDVFTLPRILEKCQRVATTELGTYFYEVNDQGITMKANGDALAMLLDAHLHSGYSLADSHYYMHVANIQIDVYEQTGRLLLPQKEVDLSQLSGFVAKGKGMIINILGIKALCKALKNIHRLTRSHS